MRVSLFAEKLRAILKKCSVFFSTFKNKMLGKPGKEKLNKLIRSSVALVLMVVMLITLTFSWLKDSITSNISNSNYITIDADAGLQMNYGEEENPDGSININNSLRDGFMLHECSSVDGRNIFFPVYDYSASGDKNFVTNVNTNDLVFREATANDKNSKYISVDFTLSAKDDTDVWLSGSSYIDCDSSTKAANAIRIAFVDKSVDGSSTVFSSAVDKNYTQNDTIDAVKSISTAGLSSTETVKPHAFNEYTYGNEAGNVLFHINAGETLRASMIVWLEGTDPDCTKDVLNISDLDIYIKFTTSYEAMRTITFIDSTLEKWVDGRNDNVDTYVYIIDNNNKHHEMTKSANYDNDYTWTANIPEGITSIRFARYNPELQGDKPTEWNYWEAGTLGSCSTYYAIGHSAGLWAINFVPETITIFDGTRSGWLRSSDECEFKIKYTVTDGNGKPQQMDYKMSYQHECNRYSIIIPKNVTQVSFHRVYQDMTETGNNWTYLNRGTNTYYAITGNNAGYWGNRYIYIEDAADMHPGCEFAAYFYGTGGNTWTGMHSRDNAGHGWYVAVVPYNMTTGVVFTRYNGSASSWDWSNVYNQVSDKDNELKEYGSKNLFKTTGYVTVDGKSCIDGEWYTTTD